jgi:hypothetical protein
MEEMIVEIFQGTLLSLPTSGEKQYKNLRIPDALARLQLVILDFHSFNYIYYYILYNYIYFISYLMCVCVYIYINNSMGLSHF